MSLHLVGETLDKGRGYYQAEAGKLIQLMRGIYVDVSDDIDRSEEHTSELQSQR